MAFTAQIIGSTTLPDGRVQVEVNFTNGVSDLANEMIIPSDDNGLKFAIQQRLNTLNFTPPAPGLFVAKPDPVVVLPALEAARNLWFTKVNRYSRLKVMIADGTITALQADLPTRLADITATFLPDYVNFV